MPSRVPLRLRLEWLVIGLTLLVLGGVFFLAHQQGPRFRVSGHMGGVRLVGVRPDGSDDIFDPRGRKVMEIIFAGENVWVWGTGALRRDFLIEIPPGIRPAGYEVIYDRGTRRTMSTLTESSADAPRRLEVTATLSAVTFHKQFLFLRRAAPIEFVDLKLRYEMEGAPQVLVSFAGPFANGATNRGAHATEIVFTAAGTDAGEPAVHFQARSGAGNPAALSLVFFDAAGRPHRPVYTRVQFEKGGAQWTGRIAGVALEGVSRVTLNQMHETTFHHIRVAYPDRPPRPYPAYADALQALVGGEISKPQDALRYSFRDVEMALKALDIVRGPTIHSAWAVINRAHPPVAFSRMSSEERSRIGEVARAWRESSNPRVRLAGAGLALHLGHPEFVQDLIDATRQPATMRDRGSIVETLLPHASLLDAEHLKQLAELARQDRGEDGYRVFNSVVRILRTNDTSSARAALRELCRDEEPSVWWRAARVINRDDQLARDDRLVACRIAMTRQSNNGLPKEIALCAAREAPRWVTLELHQRDATAFTALYHRMVRLSDRGAATEAMVELLRGVVPEKHDWLVTEILRQLNAWYGQNFAGIGSKASVPAGTLSAETLKQGREEALRWQAQRKAAEANSP